MSISRPKGTNDFLPDQTGNWRTVEDALHYYCQLYGYGEIRTPIFEQTELFQRGVGNTTDIVQKEMYTFSDKGERSFALRPENTAAVARAYIENKLSYQTPPVKLYYIGPMFRSEKPQAGRFRQFHQFGMEAFGSSLPVVDAEIIEFSWEFLNRLAIADKKLFINSVGCPKCRPAYRKLLNEYLKEQVNGMCQDCKTRFELNPMRMFDCKEEACQKLLKDAPVMLDHLCPECSSHFQQLKGHLDAAHIPYEVNSRMVRGLDYYTKTAFEIVSDELGAQSALCGGGRYDGLVEEIGGEPTPGVGVSMGLERVIQLAESQGKELYHAQPVDIYVATIDSEPSTWDTAFSVACALRQKGHLVELNMSERSLKSQLKQADKLEATHSVLIGGDELKSGDVVIRKMDTSQQVTIPLDEVPDAF